MALPVLERVIKEGSTDLKVTVAAVLVQEKHPGFAGLLKALEEDSNPEVRNTIMAARMKKRPRKESAFWA
jgi:hypothetical protein